MSKTTNESRAISPVIGAVLLIGIVLLLSSVSMAMIFGLTEERDTAPEVTFSLESDRDAELARQLVHDQGKELDGDKVEIRGVADPDGLSGKTFAAAQEHRVIPIDETITVVWFGDHGSGYTLWEFSVDPAVDVPEPDVACDWVDDESNGGVDDVKVDDTVVNCDVVTDKVVEVQNDGVVIGDITSQTKLLDADDATVVGTVTVEEDANVQDSTVTGSITAKTEGVKVDNATVADAVEGEKTVEVIAGSSVAGDVVSNQNDVKVLGDSDVSGSVVSHNGQVKLQDVTIDGHVYVDPAKFDCTNATINGQSCSEYTPRSPSNYS